MFRLIRALAAHIDFEYMGDRCVRFAAVYANSTGDLIRIDINVQERKEINCVLIGRTIVFFTSFLIRLFHMNS